MSDYPAYTLIDLNTWPRRKHFLYYQEQIPCAHSVTMNLDVTETLKYAHENHQKFSSCLMYAVCRTVNNLDCTKMMLTEEGVPGIWDQVNPVFTVFHEDDQTFSDLWMEYKPGFSDFCREHESVVRKYGKNKGIKGRAGQPANFFCFSCAPWLDFAAYSAFSAGNRIPPLFPIISCGKYKEVDGRYQIPVSLSISHAAMDGYHLSLFFERLQENLHQIQL